MKILVLGGTGPMGKPLVKMLADNGNYVYVTSRFKHESNSNINYIVENALNIDFIKDITSSDWDVVIDFMCYEYADFNARLDLILANTKQYIFLSSSRVYADSDGLITETSDRLIDVCGDQKYVNSDEYAIVKARQENLLFENSKRNWTIIRPYITYNTYRLQLGVYEKEQWLYRVINNKKIILPRDINSKVTAFTYGEDVAKVLSNVAGNEETYGKVFHIVNPEQLTWNEILNIYTELIDKYTNEHIRMIFMENSDKLKMIWNPDQITYDRLYNRRFDNSNVEKIVGKVNFTPVAVGLEKCISEFVSDPKWLDNHVRFEGWADKQTREMQNIFKIKGMYNKALYMKHRMFG